MNKEAMHLSSAMRPLSTGIGLRRSLIAIDCQVDSLTPRNWRLPRKWGTHSSTSIKIFATKFSIQVKATFPRSQIGRTLSHSSLTVVARLSLIIWYALNTKMSRSPSFPRSYKTGRASMWYSPTRPWCTMSSFMKWSTYCPCATRYCLLVVSAGCRMSGSKSHNTISLSYSHLSMPSAMW